jgi:hypothetical protein
MKRILWIFGDFRVNFRNICLFSYRGKLKSIIREVKNDDDGDDDDDNDNDNIYEDIRFKPCICRRMRGKKE